MKAIIIGAGSGRRIGKFAEKIPKSLLDVNGKTILENQFSVLKKNGINNIILVTGPDNYKFNFKEISYVHDSHYAEHDILGSLMEAKDQIVGDVIILYSDIIFDESIFLQVSESKSDIGIAVDMDWEQAYLGRTEHPKSEAENVLLTNDGRISRIQKNISNSNGKIGEFIGIMKLSDKGSNIFVDKFENLQKSHKGPFHNADSFDKAYLTDIIQELLDSKIDVTPIFVSGKWCEIDTLQDLNRARNLFSD